jgi:hypothetical protein
MEETLDPQGANLKRRYVGAAGTPRMGAGLFNVRRNELCTPDTGDGTTWRCETPQTTPGGSYYADAGCTQPVWVTENKPCSSPNLLYEETDEVTCPRRRALYQKAGPFTGPLFGHLTTFSADGTKARSCKPLQVDPGLGIFALTPVPDSEYPALTIVER